MTDNTGILQHAVFHLPNYNEGYTTDDNARALVLAVLLDRLMRSDAHRYPILYLPLPGVVWQHSIKNNRFRISYFDRRWMEESLEDSHVEHCGARRPG
jgi:hypothetical protein